MTSVFAAMAGIILASRMFSGQPAASPNLHFDAITACNLAGVSMVGGVGSIPSVALGVILGSGLQLWPEHGRRVPVLAVGRPCGAAVRLSGH